MNLQTIPISIITPAFHAQEYIVRSVQSVLAQTHTNWEMIIIADDGLDYKHILKSHGIADPRLRFATTGKNNPGPGAARNTGLDLANHDIIANLDADDAIAPDYLSRLLPAVMQYGACTPQTRVIDAKTGIVMPIGFPLHVDAMLTMYDLMRHCPTFAPIMFNRRWTDARWPQLHYGEDLLFWLLLMNDLPGIYYVAGARYDYNVRRGSLSRPDEETTHGLVYRRNRMIEWLTRHTPAAHNAANWHILKRWLATCNAMEETVGYQLLDIDVYIREINRRFRDVFSGFEADYNLTYA